MRAAIQSINHPELKPERASIPAGTLLQLIFYNFRMILRLFWTGPIDRTALCGGLLETFFGEDRFLSALADKNETLKKGASTIHGRKPQNS